MGAFADEVFFLPCLSAKKMMCPSGFFQSKVVSWKFLMGQLKSTVWPLMAVTRCHTARETASQCKWFQWEGVQTLLCMWERCRGGRQKEIFDETTPKDAAAPPVHTVLVWQEVCGQSFHGKRESKQTCKIDICFPVCVCGEEGGHSCGGQVGLNNWRSLGHFFHMCGLSGRCHLILDENELKKEGVSSSSLFFATPMEDFLRPTVEKESTGSTGTFASSLSISFEIQTE